MRHLSDIGNSKPGKMLMVTPGSSPKMRRTSTKMKNQKRKRTSTTRVKRKRKTREVMKVGTT